MKKRIHKKQAKKFSQFLYSNNNSERIRIFGDKSMHNYVFKRHYHKQLRIEPKYNQFALLAVAA